MNTQINARLRVRKETARGTEVLLEFLLNGSPIARTRRWRDAPALVAPLVARALRRLMLPGHAMLLSVCSGRRVRRIVAGQRLAASSEEALYIEYVMGGGGQRYSCRFGRYGSRFESGLVLECPAKLIGEVVRVGWDWHSFRGCVVRKGAVDAALMRLHRVAEPHNEILRVREAVLTFQDWSDAGALLIRSRQVSASRLQRRLAVRN